MTIPAHDHAADLRGTLLDERRRRRLVGLCAAISGDRGAAEDLAQETLLEAWRNGHKLYDPAGVDAWVSAIARNVCARWARGRARELRLVEAAAVDAALVERHDLEVGLERPELVELLDRALGTLSSPAREVLVRHYVEESTHAEIASALGISEDAVSMRISRGKLQLRRLLEPTDSHESWRETRVWCSNCGRRRLLQRVAEDRISFRCAGSDEESVSHELPLGNPFFAGLVADVVRPSAILGRLAEWSRRYFAAGVGSAACTRCGAEARVGHDPGRRGLIAVCGSCGDAVSSSLLGLAGSLPETRSFRRGHPRLRVAPLREVEHGGVPAVVVRHESVLGRAAVDAVFARDTLRLLLVDA